MKKPLILIQMTMELLQKEYELIGAVKVWKIIVAAPAYPQSGMGHAITVGDTLKIKSQIFKDIEVYECSGTPLTA